MKVLHLCFLDKFIPPYLDFIREHFPHEDHFFFMRGDFKKYKYKQDRYTLLYKNKLDLVFILRKMISAEKIILHGLFDKKIISILFFNPYLLKKCHWVIWGGDLYEFRNIRYSAKSRWHEFMRKHIIKRFGYLLTYIDGDIALAKEFYQAKGKHLETIAYLSNVVDFHICENSPEKDIYTHIMIGNSANPTNHHFKIIDMIHAKKLINIKVYAPLTYGDENYADKVIEYGKKKLGAGFIPITNHILITEYLLFLQSIDIAIFYHDRQQAMGNTVNLLAMGKTVYLRSGTSHWKFFQDKNIEVFDFSTFDIYKRANTEKNRTIISTYFSYSTLLNQWEKIFQHE